VSALVVLALAVPGGAAAAAAPAKAPKPAAKIVVKTSDQLRNALRSVPDGGVIELRAGTYRSPAGGFSLDNLKKAFTVQAAPGAAVVLGGEGQRPVLHFKNTNPAKGKKVTFRGLAFRKGVATPGKTDAGGVTLQAAQAEFVDCTFTGNTTSGVSVGGGALRLAAKSVATLTNCRFEGNGTTRRGGAVEVVDSTLAMTSGQFVGNRSNLPGHAANAVGGAVFLQNATAAFTDVLFSANEAAWVGGALYAFGTWTDPVAVPRTAVRLERTSFFANRAQPAPGQTVIAATQGGAIHAEDQTAVTVADSAFADNAAAFGAAINVYRAALEVTGSIFRNHRAGADGSGLGGAIAALSADQADGSTAGGTINRPNARVVIRDSLLQGPLDPALAAAVTGGCLLAAGDGARVTGGASVPADGGVEANRGELELERVVFNGCTVARAGAAAGAGGALRADLVALDMRDTLVLGSTARGQDGAGGGLSLVGATFATLAGVTFAGNAADHSGGAIQVRGALLDADGCSFLGNSVAGGGGAVGDSRGAALFAIPSARDAAAGTVQRSLFAGQAGIDIRDVDQACPLVNDLRYDENRFFLSGGNFGETVYVHNPQATFGLDVQGLNDVTISRACGSTDKSAVPNTREFAPPAEGALAAIQSAGSTGQRLGPFLAFAWTGAAATLDGAPLAARFGLVAAPAPGEHRLDVAGGESATVVVE
jgi:predicted outer membrane repeat protein